MVHMISTLCSISAIQNGHVSAVQLLVDMKADITLPNKRGLTAVNEAMSCQQEDLRLRLLAALYTKPPPSNMMTQGNPLFRHCQTYLVYSPFAVIMMENLTLLTLGAVLIYNRQS